MLQENMSNSNGGRKYSLDQYKQNAIAKSYATANFSRRWIDFLSGLNGKQRFAPVWWSNIWVQNHYCQSAM